MATRVLVVEDDPEIRRSLCEYLADDGFDVIAAHDGEHALRLAAAGSPDVILLDIGLPRLDGTEFAERWRARSKAAQVPIVAMSGMIEGSDLASQLGATEFRAKPLDLRELADLLRTITSKEEQKDKKDYKAADCR